MSNKLKRQKKQEESLCTAVCKFFRYLLEGMIGIYAMLIIVVMPFYHEQGYAYIGTNKAMFFRTVAVNGMIFILPVLALYLVLTYAEQRSKRKGHEGETAIRLQLSFTDKCALLYGLSLLLSYICSDYRKQDMRGSALWGSEGWYMGFLTQLLLLGSYFLVSRCRTHTKWLFGLFLPVSAAVFALGYLNRFGFYPIDMKVINPGFLSTIGNINWYCGYLVSVFFGGYYLLWREADLRKTSGMTQGRENGWRARLQKLLQGAYVAVGFATLVTQGSASGLVTMGVMLVVTFCLSVGDGRRMQAFWQETLLLSFMCLLSWCLRNVCHREITFADPFVDLLTDSFLPFLAVVISLIFVALLAYCNAEKKYPGKLFKALGWLVAGGSAVGMCVVIGMIVLNTLRPGSIGALSDNAFFTFAPAWGSSRGATWEAGIRCFTEQNFLHKLVGVGPDAMDAYIAQNGSAELTALVTERFGNNRLTNAHNEWLTILVNEGILGFIGFVGMMVSAIVRYLKIGRAPGKTITSSRIIAGACGFCLLAYTVNNMFSFQQSMNTATIFLIMGIGEAQCRSIRFES